MALAEQLSTGLSMTIVGMGLVFLLLALLWALLTVLLRLDRGPASEEADHDTVRDRVRGSGPPAVAPERLAAITIAVVTHQAVLRKQAAPAMRSHWPGSILFASRWVGAGRHEQTQSWHPRKR